MKTNNKIDETKLMSSKIREQTNYNTLQGLHLHLYMYVNSVIQGFARPYLEYVCLPLTMLETKCLNKFTY